MSFKLNEFEHQIICKDGSIIKSKSRHFRFICLLAKAYPNPVAENLVIHNLYFLEEEPAGLARCIITMKMEAGKLLKRAGYPGEIKKPPRRPYYLEGPPIEFVHNRTQALFCPMCERAV